MTEITIDDIKVNESAIEAVVKIKSELNNYRLSSHDMARSIEHQIAKAATDTYLQKHLHEIMAQIDQQQILNMITLNAAKRIAQ